MVKHLLSDEGARAVEEAVRAVEKRTSTELVVAVMAKSGDYFSWRAIVALGSALAGTMGLYFIVPSLPVFWLLLLQPALGVLVFAITGWEPLYRSLIPPEAGERAVQERAFELFAELGVHRTRDRTGLLILVSELEHQVVILGDSGLHDRVGEQGWSTEVTLLITRIREGKTQAGLIEVLQHFAPILEELAPPRGDNTNELSDSVVRG